ncbi:MAG: thymidine phosphorylase [Planctomycetales bacterium]|nr:thymidine phosphorylase [Planctomycetales bacterium]
MIPAEIIRAKRDGRQLSNEQIASFIDGFARSAMPDYQMAAFAMAVFFQGMTRAETTSLTRHMLASGQQLKWNDRSVRPVVDKHSTGGIGDKVSLVLAPLLACCGVRVPMISGRGLGTTGGTLDKLESIPGFRTDLTIPEIESQVENIGCAITGATDDIVPADRRLYALRDVTATVESVPLITASILSKKLAESLDSLVLDVKVGSGSFMQTPEAAAELAQSLVDVGHALGLNTTAVLTNMDQPLGQMIGNANEVLESIECLQGRGPNDLRELAIHLSAIAIKTLQPDEVNARRLLADKLDNGEAYDRFKQLIAAQGGDLSQLAQLAEPHDIVADRNGIVESINGQTLGNVIIELGGGRKVAADKIDHQVGIEMLARVGDRVSAGQPLARVFADNAASNQVCPLLRRAIVIGDRAVIPPKLVIDRLDSGAENGKS